MRNWQRYQYEVAEVFRDLGLQAETDVRHRGARGQHDVDVVVTFRAGGVDVLWVVECKHWKRPVPKERVLVLQQVVADLGADRGLLLSESGFQAGAVRAIAHTNITLTSLADLKENAEDERRRAVVQRHLSRCATVAHRVRRLWPWTTPQTTNPRVPLEAMIEVAARSFELQNFVTPQLIRGELPLTLRVGPVPLVVTSHDSQDDAVDAACGAAEAELEVLEQYAAAAYLDARAIVAKLSVHLGTLLTIGSEFGSSIDESDVQRFVAQMQAIEAAASDLRTSTPEVVGQAVTALMRHLIESTYQLPEQLDRNWTAEQSRISALLAALQLALATVAIPDGREPNQQDRLDKSGQTSGTTIDVKDSLPPSTPRA